ncbi:uncharacterized protein VTP21DRAFT_5982 [Calcarisporiella thermophila]|uniref:uncharacterized protein n=1 Tax=Calcarisporiella thermophila TaxID=911321 RepID=UPI0037435171
MNGNLPTVVHRGDGVRRCPAKACEQCRARKARCSLDWPTCSRCRHLNIRCLYPSAGEADLSTYTRLFLQRVNQAGGRVLQLEQRWRDIKAELSSRTHLDLATISNDDSDSENAKRGIRELLGLPVGWVIIERSEGVQIKTDLLTVDDLIRFAQQQMGKIRVPDIWSQRRTNKKSGAAAGRSGQAIHITFIRKFGLYSSSGNEEANALVKHEAAGKAAEWWRYRSLIHTLVSRAQECDFLYRIMDARRFVADFPQLDPLIKWAVLAWTAWHYYYQHNTADRSSLAEFGALAFAESRRLLEERFDEPSIATVIAALALHYCVMYEGRQSPFLGLARQHVNYLRTETHSPGDLERFRRAAWAVSLLELLRAVFVDASNLYLLEPLLSEHEPGLSPGDSEEITNFTPINIFGTRALKICADMQKRKPEYETEHAFVMDFERMLLDWDKKRPSAMRVDILRAEVNELPSTLFRYILEYEMAYTAVFIQLHFNTFMGLIAGASRSSRRSHWTAAERHAYEVCRQSANRIVKLVALVVSQRKLCVIPEQADTVRTAFVVHEQIYSNSPDSSARMEARDYLVRSLELMQACAAEGLLHARYLVELIESILGEKGIKKESAEGDEGKRLFEVASKEAHELTDPETLIPTPPPIPGELSPRVLEKRMQQNHFASTNTADY